MHTLLRNKADGAGNGTIGLHGGVPYGTISGGSTYDMATGPGYGVSNAPDGAIDNRPYRNLLVVIPPVKGVAGDMIGGSRAASMPAVGGFGAPVELAIIVASTTAAINAAHAASLSPSPSALATKISALKWLHLCMICGVATNTEVPSIWQEVAAASTGQEGLALLV